MRSKRCVMLWAWMIGCGSVCVTGAAWASECPPLLVGEESYHADFETGRRIRTVPLKLHPEGPSLTMLYGEAHVLALGQRCHFSAVENVLTLYDPDGTVRWSLGMQQLLPGRDFLQRGANRWYLDVRRKGSDIDRGASIVLVAHNYDEVQVRLRDGEVKLRNVPVAELGNDAVKLKARALYLGRTDDREGQQLLLRKILTQNPRDYEVVAILAENLARNHLPLQSAALWRDLESLLPLLELPSPTVSFEFMRGVPSLTEMHYQQARYLKQAGSYRAALALIEERLQAGIEEVRVWQLQAEVQVALGRDAEAKASFDRAIALTARRSLAPSQQSCAQEYYYAVDYAAQSLEVVGYEALGNALRQRPAAQAEVIADLRTKALQSSRRECADLLGRIYVGADAQGDFRQAIEWYTLSAGRPGGYRETEAELALCHLHRHSGSRPDYATALRYCDEAVERGSVPARFWAGMLRLAGLGTPRDEATGLALLASALAGDEYHAVFTESLPEQRRGFGTAQDFHWAAEVLEPYAASGNAMVQTLLTQMQASNAWRVR